MTSSTPTVERDANFSLKPTWIYLPPDWPETIWRIVLTGPLPSIVLTAAVWKVRKQHFARQPGKARHFSSLLLVTTSIRF
jgi:hypothetical protein